MSNFSRSTLGGHGQKRGKDKLQGIPWGLTGTCAVDALGTIHLCILSALPNKYRVPEQVSASDTIREVTKHIFEFGKIPWERRTKRLLHSFRDKLLQLVESAGVTINYTSCLLDAQEQTTPPWLVDVPISVKMKCRECRAVGIVGNIVKRGIDFAVWEEHILKLQTLQNVLDYIVHSFKC